MSSISRLLRGGGRREDVDLKKDYSIDGILGGKFSFKNISLSLSLIHSYTHTLSQNYLRKFYSRDLFLQLWSSLMSRHLKLGNHSVKSLSGDVCSGLSHLDKNSLTLTGKNPRTLNQHIIPRPLEPTNKNCWKCINDERPTGMKHTTVGWDDGGKICKIN